MRLREALSKSDESEITRIIKSTVKDELEKRVEAAVREALKDKANEKLILQVVRNAMSNMYKTLWMRRSTWLSGIENKEN
jgi:hypothetical protein